MFYKCNQFAVRKFAHEEVQPLVKEMDEKSEIPDSLIRKFFENGVSTNIWLSLHTANTSVINK